MNEIQPSETQDNLVNTLFTEISNIKNIKNIEEFNEKIRILNEKTEKIEKTELSTIHNFIIQFFTLYNNFAFKEQNKHIKKLIQLSNIMKTILKSLR